MNKHLPSWMSVAAFAVAIACAHARPAMQSVVLVQPSGPTVAANLLRFSVRFPAQVDGPVLSRLALLRADGSRIEQPFLEQELWSPDGRVLTVLMHPGRVKQGLKAREERGPILSEGDDVVLALDGHPIQRWSAGPVDETGPAPSAWKLSSVRAASRQPLVVLLDAPIDGRNADHLAIADERGHRVAGRVRLTDGENTWTFTPDAPWQGGMYKLVARGTLEDAAGNRLGSRFETSLDSPPGRPVDAMRPFRARRAAESPRSR